MCQCDAMIVYKLSISKSGKRENEINISVLDENVYLKTGN